MLVLWPSFLQQVVDHVKDWKSQKLRLSMATARGRGVNTAGSQLKPAYGISCLWNSWQVLAVSHRETVKAKHISYFGGKKTSRDLFTEGRESEA